MKVSIDGVHLGDAHHVSGPLYVLKWNPQNYSEGLHHIDVMVQVSCLLAFITLICNAQTINLLHHVSRDEFSSNIFSYVLVLSARQQKWKSDLFSEKV